MENIIFDFFTTIYQFIVDTFVEFNVALSYSA